MTFRWIKVTGTAAAGVAAFTIFSNTADGFFPPIPIGSDPSPPSVAPQVPVVPPPVVIVPPGPTSPVVPVVPVSPPPFVPVVPKEIPTTPKSPPPPHVNCPPPVRPTDVPEPATLLTGVVGLSMLGMAALKRKLRKDKGEAA